VYTRTKPTVKPTRVSPCPPSRFGAGLLPPSCPSHKAPASMSDLEWYAGIESVYGDDQWDADEAMEVQAAEAEAMDRLERGLICQDVAIAIERTSLVGHRP
jgi:hypothetical protein